MKTIFQIVLVLVLVLVLDPLAHSQTNTPLTALPATNSLSSTDLLFAVTAPGTTNARSVKITYANALSNSTFTGAIIMTSGGQTWLIVPSAAGLVISNDFTGTLLTLGYSTAITTLQIHGTGTGTNEGDLLIGGKLITSTNVQFAGYLTNLAGPGIYFGTTNNPTFGAANGSTYQTSSGNGISYLRSNATWIIH